MSVAQKKRIRRVLGAQRTSSRDAAVSINQIKISISKPNCAGYNGVYGYVLTKYRLSLGLIFPFVHDAFPHAIDIFLAWMLPLFHIYVAHYLVPSGLHVEPLCLLMICLLFP